MVISCREINFTKCLEGITWLVIFLLLGLDGAVSAGGEVNIYSGRKEALIGPVLDAFTEETGIHVNLLTGKADQLRTRLEAEGRNSPADVLLTSDVANLYRATAAGLFQELDSDLLRERIPSRYRDPSGRWYGLSIRARVIAYSKSRVREIELSSYEDLADARWRGRVIVRSSSNVYNQSLIASMLSAHGKASAGYWIRGLVANMARKPQGGDTDQIRAVAAGEADVAIVNSYYYGRLIASERDQDHQVVAAVGVFFPNQGDRGTHVNISGAGIVANSKNRAEAVSLLEFLTGPLGQQLFADLNHEFPANPGVSPSPIVSDWGSFRADSVPLAKLGELNGAAIRLADEQGWR